MAGVANSDVSMNDPSSIASSSDGSLPPPVFRENFPLVDAADSRSSTLPVNPRSTAGVQVDRAEDHYLFLGAEVTNLGGKRQNRADYQTRLRELARDNQIWTVAGFAPGVRLSCLIGWSRRFFPSLTS
ncbi:uncharacterized protein PG986_004399 [Apiospora aurea]|uniref:Uncharacterized protein n=1 Tax=Apiospora aurea TaxID=335848 RepID=A0ABR1QN79_9PEZI